MFGSGFKFSKETWERVKKVSEVAGYSSPEEFVAHIVERELKKLETADSKEALIEKMKGLGYLE
jgi:putative aminopeptidase FrvX